MDFQIRDFICIIKEFSKRHVSKFREWHQCAREILHLVIQDDSEWPLNSHVDAIITNGKHNKDPTKRD